jgi:hypothetical protein
VDIIEIKNEFNNFNEKNQNKLIEEGWSELKEPKSLLYQIVFLLPLIIILPLIALFITSMLISSPDDIQASGTITVSNAGELLRYCLIFLSIVLTIGVALVVAHELIHLLFIPNSFKSDSGYMKLTSFIEGVHITDEMPKYRLCFMYIAPFLFLSVVLNTIIGILGLYNLPILVFIILNSIGCSDDILELILILSQVPKSAKIMSNGAHKYFRVDSKSQNYAH